VRGLEAECASALIGLGGVALDQGNLDAAEAHFRRASRAALRQGRNRLAGSAFHELFAVAINAGRHDDAVCHADRTISLYPAKHHRIPNLAYDIALFWMQLGYFSSAIYLCEKVLPWFEAQPLRILVLAALARSSGAVHDRIRYERTSAEVLRMVAAGNDWTAASLYHLAEGVRYFEQWGRAESLALRSLEEAKRVGNRTVIAASENLLITLLLKTQGPDDVVPEEGSLVDRVTDAVLRKLARQPAPGISEAVLFPERHQMD
jgi:tetratricopeptide (TPR) repeat protein